jgi:hypothetical protein
MQTFAHVLDGAVREIVSVPDGLRPGWDIYTLDFAADLKPCGADVRERWLFDGSDFAAPPVSPETVPSEVSSAQAKIQLSRAGFLPAVKATVEAMGGEVEIWFTDARVWQRNNPHVVEIGTGLHLSSDEIDGLFRDAAKIDA